MLAQLSLLGHDPPRFDADFRGTRRLALGETAWVDHLPGAIHGDAALFEELRRTVPWRRERRQMYDRLVDVPRLTAFPDRDEWRHPLLDSLAASLGARYGHDLGSISFALYRDGNDSVAPHADRVGRQRNRTVIAIASLGGARRFQIKPGPGCTEPAARSATFDLGHGDLLVMGGTCQRGWLHGIAKVARADPRISVQFREPSAPAPVTTAAPALIRSRERSRAPAGPRH